MSLLQIIVLALVQGITEFLPISSSGHLILVPFLTGWDDQGMLIDVSVHIGTLLAVLVYFKDDTKGLTMGALSHVGVKGASDHYVKLFRLLVLATVPVVIAGGAFVVFDVNGYLRSAEVIGVTSIVFGLLLWWVDKRATLDRGLDGLTMGDAVKMGLAQVLSLIPGTSRAGITMTMARQLGYKRTEAAHFSMLMAIPTIIAAGSIATLKLIVDGSDGQIMDALLTGGLAFLAALVAIHFLMNWLKRANMTIFVIYRVALGVALLAYVFMSPVFLPLC
ncbi:MAG: undecaprenyl-diphosphate phosphatase [Sphingomonadales bacterium]|nr:undecaprenyl-diphosphate phosphatase [Sphingomonadales bacterium]